jgi:biotin-dependent carboxylase-like uncharacterized protein
VANWLVGNSSQAALLEITLFRLELLALNNLEIAITGANLLPHLNGQPISMWENVHLKTGDRLVFKGRKSGLRAYLAVRGGFSGPEFLGSRSVFPRGLMGQPLQAGDILEMAEVKDEQKEKRYLPADLIPAYSHKDSLRVILGPQEDRFTPAGIKTFLSSAYRVSAQADRMGYRLEGPKIEHGRGADIISEPIVPGAIQVPGDGLPIILLWDAQVSGGYTKIASVISADLNYLAQVMPGDNLRFKEVDLAEAHEALKKEKALLQEIKKILRNP